MKQLILAAVIAFVPFSAMAELPSYVTGKMRAACEADVRRHCVKGGKPTYVQMRACVAKNFQKMSNDCQYEIVSALPRIEEWEKRNGKR